MLDKFFNLLKQESPILPNRFTEALGVQIRKARREEKMSQSDLADSAYLKQSSISKIESGMRAVSTEELLYISYALNKPLLYFFPKEFSYDLEEDDLSTLEKELIIHARQLERSDLRKLIAQARAIVEYKD